MRVKFGELLTPLIVFIYVAIYYSQIHRAPLKAGGWPKALLLVSVALSLPIVYQAFRAGGAQTEGEATGVLENIGHFFRAQRKVIGLIAGLAVYCAVVPFLGFLLSTFLFMFLSGWYIGGKPVAPLVSAACFILFVYVVCVRIMHMQMPTLFS